MEYFDGVRHNSINRETKENANRPHSGGEREGEKKEGKKERKKAWLAETTTVVVVQAASTIAFGFNLCRTVRESLSSLYHHSI